MGDPLFDAYDRVSRRIAELVGGGDRGAAVPACPHWSVHDVVAHLAGLAADIVNGNTDEYAQPGWTAAQVTVRRDSSLSELLAAWRAAIPKLREAPLPAVGRPFRTVGRLVFVDAAVHEHDLRGALGAPDPVDEAVLLALDVSAELLGRVLRRPQEQGLAPALQVVATGARSWLFGDGANPVTVEGPPFELWRGLTGRRTGDQVAALSWSGDATPFLPSWAFGPLSFPARPLDY